ncbi:serpin family protein [Adhaeribacter aquaticus]|uniref:serpin family protein n=1 Tax=Adhaeribacter aquaticus TaxID=299567 RepID=UPI0004067F95|nr:serpin family protein [Adhaeribacter aquaticus]
MKRYINQLIFLGLTGMLFSFASCQNDLATPEQNNTPDLRPLTNQEAKTVESSNDFAFKVFSAIRQKEERQNIFISPFSISSALTMAYNGADGATKAAMQEALGFAPQTEEEINQSFKSLNELLNGIDKKVTFTSANSIWHTKTYQLQAPFVQKNKTYFGATIQGLDFAAPGTKTTINNWVKEKTQGKIESIVEDIHSGHVLFLINAIYFKGAWTYTFDKKLTQKLPFTKEDNSTSSVDFMTLKDGKYLYYQDATKQLIDLPYGNRQFSMTILVPKGQNTVSSMAANLNSTQLASWVKSADTTRLELKMPKFKLEYKKELKEALTQLGMGNAFSISADFSRMIEGKAGGLAISEVKHKTFVDVNEEGTEAAAATSVGIVLTSLPPSILVNKPFIFLIREKSTNAILFIGQLMNP